MMSIPLALLMAAGAGTAQQMANGAVTEIPGLNLQANAAANAGGKTKDDLLAGTEKFAQGASSVTEINLDPTTMGMMGDQRSPIGKAASEMKLMVVHTYSYDKPGLYRMEDVDAYEKKLEDGSWSCPVVTRAKDRLAYICSRADSDHETNEMVILTAEPQKLTFIHMVGKMSLNDLTEMSDRAKSLDRRVAPPNPPRFAPNWPGGPIVFPSPLSMPVPQPSVTPPAATH